MATVSRSESYLAHAVRAFFLNGGRRLYVSRVFVPVADDDNGCAHLDLTISGADSANWTARWPGRYGNVLLVVRPVRKGNCSYQHATFGTQARGLTRGAVVEVTNAPALPPNPDADVATGQLRVVDVDPTTVDAAGLAQQTFHDNAGTAVAVPAGAVIKEVSSRCG